MQQGFIFERNLRAGFCALAVILSLGCSPSLQTDLIGSFDTPSTGEDGQSADTEGEGSIAIEFIKPTDGKLPTQNFDVEIKAEPLNDLRDMKLYINDKLVRSFNRSPFTVNVNPSQHEGTELKLRAESLDKEQKRNWRILTLKSNNNGGGQNPNPQPGTGSSKEAGTFDTNCLNNNNYDACIFWKNPVAQRNQAYSRTLTYGDNIQEQTFGVKITGTQNNELRNSSINVYATHGIKALQSGGNWRSSWQTDRGKHSVAQLMTYFWLQYQEQQMVTRSGQFYARNRNIPVDAYNTSVQNNAYWDTQKIVMGVITSSSGAAHEMALSSEVLLHEMGHANLQYAVGRFLQDSNAGSQGTCRTQFGCIGAINEGQADFHFLMLFEESSSLGETFINDVRGISQQGIPRDPRRNNSYSISQFFSQSGGAIHTMGSAYASILWNIYQNPQMNKRDFEKMFSRHLQKMTESSRFTEAKEYLLSDDQVHFNGKYQSIINEAFSSRGL